MDPSLPVVPVPVSASETATGGAQPDANQSATTTTQAPVTEFSASPAAPAAPSAPVAASISPTAEASVGDGTGTVAPGALQVNSLQGASEGTDTQAQLATPAVQPVLPEQTKPTEPPAVAVPAPMVTKALDAGHTDASTAAEPPRVDDVEMTPASTGDATAAATVPSSTLADAADPAASQPAAIADSASVGATIPGQARETPVTASTATEASAPSAVDASAGIPTKVSVASASPSATAIDGAKPDMPVTAKLETIAPKAGDAAQVATQLADTAAVAPPVAATTATSATTATAPSTTTAPTTTNATGKHALSGGSSKSEKATKKQRLDKKASKKAFKAAAQRFSTSGQSRHQQQQQQQQQQMNEHQFEQHRQQLQQLQQQQQLQQRQQAEALQQYERQVAIAAAGTPILVQTPVLPGADQQRQLKVEDALAYLDRVKNQFGNQPEVYNQFLEIMKNFKSQTIDTPGVIERVSDLFRGHNNLILGFNTFLPPGFKIEIPSAQNNYGLPLLSARHHLMQGGSPSAHLPGMPQPPGSLTAEQQQQQHFLNQQGQLENMMGSGGSGGAFRAGLAGVSAGGSLNQGGVGGIANTMAQSGSTNRQTRVSTGFPSGLMAREGGGGINGGMQANATTTQQQQQQHSAMMLGASEEAMKQHQHNLLLTPVTAAMSVQLPGGGGGGGAGGQHDEHQQQQALAGGDGGGADDNGRQPIEFDHAINYVTKIKKRFSNDADTYKQFLDILHTYQKEQRSIKEVLDQVSELFKDHPDLLQQFTFFLPDAVREKASIEIQRITREREQRDRRDRNKRSAKAKAKDKPRDKSAKGALSRMPHLERKLFQRIKAALSANETWGEFLKCLDLFAQELLSRSELIGLLSDIFGSERHELLEEFDRLLASRGATENLQEDAWFSMPLQDIDFAQCRRCTPSYRALPVTYPKPPCSERTALCRSVLNDSWVSMPTGSEDFSFMRKNQYEEALFKCEDDRYEIDLVIESNAATIRRLEPLVREIDALRLKTGDVSRFRYKLDRRTLSAIHLKAIVRVYGEHGTEILELLRKNPAGAIPVILTRLKQKDTEWRQSRKELNKGWKDTMAKSYYKALDHRGFYFKQSDKRACTTRQMLADVKEKAKAREAAAATVGATSGESILPQHAGAEGLGSGGTIDDPDVTMEFDDVTVHQQAWALLQYTAEVQMSKEEAERANSLYRQFFHPLFRLPESWKETLSALSADEIKSLHWDAQVTAGLVNAHGADDAKLSASDALPAGTHVVSEYGAGAIEAFDEDRQVYQVQLGFGTAFLRPSMVVVDGSVANDVDPATQPMRTLGDGGDADDNGVRGDSPAARSPVFYAPVHCYYFLQLYSLLFTRLRDLKHLCESGQVRTQGDSVPHAVDRALKEALNKEREGGVGTSPSDAAQDRPQEPAERFRAAMALVYGIVDGSIEGARFEDEMRGLLGAGSFFMFTVDKVVTLATKQLVALVSDDKLIDSVRAMDEYESNNNSSTSSAGSMSRTGAGLAAVYKANEAVLLLQEGCCFRFQYIPGKLKSRADQHAAAAATVSALATTKGEGADSSNGMGMEVDHSSSEGGNNNNNNNNAGNPTTAVVRKPDAHSLPSEIQTEFTKPRVTSDAWLQAPRLVVQMVDSVPCSTQVPPPSTTSQAAPMVLTVKPLVVDFGAAVDASTAESDVEMMSTVAATAGAGAGAGNGEAIVTPAGAVANASAPATTTTTAAQEQQQPKKQKKPFLMRTKVASRSGGGAGAANEMQQGLRMSLLLPLYRVAYVPGSEDVFRCMTAFHEANKSKSGEAANEEREKKYKAWFEAKTEDLLAVSSSKTADAAANDAPAVAETSPATAANAGDAVAAESQASTSATGGDGAAVDTGAAAAVKAPAASSANAVDVEMGAGGGAL